MASPPRLTSMCGDEEKASTALNRLIDGWVAGRRVPVCDVPKCVDHRVSGDMDGPRCDTLVQKVLPVEGSRCQVKIR